MVSSMNTTFLTIAEASAKTGRSPSTVRRLIHTLTQDDKHAEREAVEPTPAQVVAFKKKGDTILDVLQHELSLKNEQIAKQWEVIHALNDRLREGNILMGSLQQRLALPETASPTPSTVEVATAKPTKKSSVKASKPVEASVKPASRRGIFNWFGK